MVAQRDDDSDPSICEAAGAMRGMFLVSLFHGPADGKAKEEREEDEEEIEEGEMGYKWEKLREKIKAIEM